MRLRSVFILMFAVLSVGGCATQAAPVALPMVTVTVTATLPPTSTSTLTPTSLSSATPETFELASIRLPQAAPGINAYQLWGHVESAVYCPNPDRLAIATSRGFVLYTLPLLTDWVETPQIDSHGLGVACSPDGKWLAVGLEDGRVEIWNTTTLEMQKQFTSGDQLIDSLAWSPNGKQLAVLGGGEIRFWDPLAGTIITSEYQYLEGTFRNAIWSPDQRWFATSFGPIRIWSATSSERIGFFGVPNAEGDDIVALGWSPDSKVLAGGGMVGEVLLWDAATQQMTRLLSARMPVSHIAWSPDGKLLAIGGGAYGANPSMSDRLQLWDTTTWQEVLLLNPGGYAISVFWMPDNSALITANENGVINVWNIDLLLLDR